MKTLISVLSAVVLLSACSQEAPRGASNEFAPYTPSLLDVAAPEEVAEELGLSTQDSDSVNIAQEAWADSVPRLSGEELSQYYPVVVVVSKAQQRMTIYHRGQNLGQVLVSTGRERWEIAKSGRRYFSTTGTGWFAPIQTFDKYFSNTWKAWMNWSVFFNGGIAIHATTPDHYAELGSRASGGCVRLHEANAKWLYNLILSEGKGQVPAFVREGRILKNSDGTPVYKQGWKTLIVVE